MLFCIYCGKPVTHEVRFCPYCGKELPRSEATTTAPPNLSTAHTAYTYVAQPTMSNSGRVFGNLAFILGLFSLIASSALVAIFVILLSTDYFGSLRSFELASIGPAILSIIFCSQARKRGNLLTKPKLGRLFGIIALVLSFVSLILFFVYAGQLTGDIIGNSPGFST